MLHRAIAISFLFSTAAFAGAAGLVTVVGADPVMLQLMLPASSSFELQYNGANLSVWTSASRETAIPPGVARLAPDLVGDVQMDCDIDLRDIAVFSRCFTGSGGGPPATGCSTSDFNANGAVELLDFGVVQSAVSGPAGSCPQLPVLVFVEGLAVSQALGDRTIDVLVDPEGDGTFTLQETKIVTNVLLQASPMSGTWGTPISVTLQPAIAPLAFDATTTATWTNVYIPNVGPASQPFVFSFNSQQVRESGSSTAVVLAGDGTLSGSLPTPQVLATTSGSLSGELAFLMGGGQIELRRRFVFTPTSQLRFLELMDDPANPDNPPAFGGELAEIESVIVDDPLNPPLLTGVRGKHFAIEICMANAPQTISVSPPTISATVMTLDTNGVIVDLVANVPFDRSTATLPDCQLYRSLATVPMILVSQSVNKQLFPTLTILRAVQGGKVVAVPGGTP